MSSLRGGTDSSAVRGLTRGVRSHGGVVPRLLSGVGVALCLVVVAEWVVFARLQLHLVLHPANLAGLLTSVPFMAALVYGGRWLAHSEISPDRYVRVAGWCAGGMAASLGLNLLVISTTPLEDLWYLVGWLRWAVAIGGGVGLLIGVIEARAIERERAAERATARAEFAESQREWLDYLNGLLRHEVLNTSTVVSGRATLLLDEYDLDDDVRSHLEAISRQSDEMTNVIRDVRVLLAAANGEVSFEPRDLEALLRGEIETLHDRYDGVETELSVPDDLTVAGDDLLPRLFSNLLSNAVVHDASDEPRVAVTGESTGDTVTVRIADDGQGIPDSEVESLFERDTAADGTHGLGLYIVRTLAERYGGSVELTETGADGTVFTVELPRVGCAPDGRSGDVSDERSADATGEESGDSADGSSGDAADERYDDATDEAMADPA